MTATSGHLRAEGQQTEGSKRADAASKTGRSGRSKLLKRMGVKAAEAKRTAPPVTLKPFPWSGDHV
jgi:hypothetical protein